jgi:hypothetical protein
MAEAQEILKMAKELLAGPADSILRRVQKTLNRLDDLSDNIEDAVETFSLHFRVASDTDVKSQFELLSKAREGLKAAHQARKSLERVSSQYPEDKTVQRALKDADVMIRRFQRHEADARKVIQALSKKAMPPGLTKYAQSVARIIRGKFNDPKALKIIPWQQDHYKGGVVYQVNFRVLDVGELGMNGVVNLMLGEWTNSREPAGVMDGFQVKQMSPKQAAEHLLDRLRGWPGLKGAEAEIEKRDAVVQDVSSAMKRAFGAMRPWMQNDPETRRGGTTVHGSYRSTLPKDGARAVGEYAYDRMVEEEIESFKKVFEPLVKPYMGSIRGISYYPSEKSWIEIEVRLK